MLLLLLFVRLLLLLLISFPFSIETWPFPISILFKNTHIYVWVKVKTNFRKRKEYQLKPNVYQLFLKVKPLTIDFSTNRSFGQKTVFFFSFYVSALAPMLLVDCLCSFLWKIFLYLLSSTHIQNIIKFVPIESIYFNGTSYGMPKHTNK